MAELVKQDKTPGTQVSLKGVINEENRCAAIAFSQIMGRAAAYEVPGGAGTWLPSLQGHALYEVLAHLLDASNGSPLYVSSRKALSKEVVDPLLSLLPDASGRANQDIIEATQLWMDSLGNDRALPFSHERIITRKCVCGHEELESGRVCYFTLPSVNETLEDLLLQAHTYEESLECMQCGTCNIHVVTEHVIFQGNFVLVRIELREGEDSGPEVDFPPAFAQTGVAQGGSVETRYGILAVGLSFPGHFTALLRSSVPRQWMHANDAVVQQIFERPKGSRTVLLLYGRDVAVDASAARICGRPPGGLPLSVNIQFAQWSLRKRTQDVQSPYPNLRAMMEEEGMEVNEGSWKFLAGLQGSELEAVIERSSKRLLVRREMTELKAARAPKDRKSSPPLFAPVTLTSGSQGVPMSSGGPPSQQLQPSSTKSVMPSHQQQQAARSPPQPIPSTIGMPPPQQHQSGTGLQGSGCSPPLSPSEVIVSARMELLSASFARTPGTTGPPDDGVAARATLERTAPPQGFLVGQHVRDRLVQPHLLPGTPAARASQLAAEIREMPEVYRWILEGAPVQATALPLHDQALRFVAQSVQRRMERLIVQTEVDTCRTQRGVHEYIAHHEMIQLLTNIGRSDMLTHTERAPRRGGPPSRGT